jgi:hypothetical protein
MQFTKENVAERFREIEKKGWVRSVGSRSNVGAVGDTLESLFGIKTNNLPIANAGPWELKAQRSNTSSLITLFHSEPLPRKAKIVPRILLPLYGWQHEEAGKKYPLTEMSFRSTTSGNRSTDRGFKVNVDRPEERVELIFESSKVEEKHAEWLTSVDQRVGLGQVNPQPYWTFSALAKKVDAKIRNALYVLADCRKEKNEEYFYYREAWMSEHANLDRFLNEIEKGNVLVDFDARTGHNHGTKFRVRQRAYPNLYKQSEKVT